MFDLKLGLFVCVFVVEDDVFVDFVVVVFINDQLSTCISILFNSIP